MVVFVLQPCVLAISEYGSLYLVTGDISCKLGKYRTSLLNRASNNNLDEPTCY